MRESFKRSPPLTLPLFGDNNVLVVATSQRRKDTIGCSNVSSNLKRKQQKREEKGEKSIHYRAKATVSRFTCHSDEQHEQKGKSDADTYTCMELVLSRKRCDYAMLVSKRKEIY